MLLGEVLEDKKGRFDHRMVFNETPYSMDKCKQKR